MNENKISVNLRVSASENLRGRDSFLKAVVRHSKPCYNHGGDPTRCSPRRPQPVPVLLDGGASVKLHEYQSKSLFARYNIPIPRGEVATTPEDVRRIAHDFGRRVVVKAQVLVGGRGKAGGRKLARDPDEAERVAGEVLSMEIKGLPVRTVLGDEAADIRAEIYLGVVIDRAQRRVVMMASSAGGIEIEEVTRETPEKIVRVAIDPFIGLRAYQAREGAFRVGLERDLARDFTL